MTMPSEDFGSDGFNPYEHEADSDPGVVLDAQASAFDAEAPQMDPSTQREMLLELKNKQIEQKVEQAANFQGMEAYYNQQKELHTQKLLARGLPPEQAASLANEATIRDVQAGAKDLINRRAAARLVAAESGVDPSAFKGLWTEREMRDRVQQLQILSSPEGQQMYQNWAQMEMAKRQLMQQGVQPQQFYRPGRGGTQASAASLRKQYADGLIGWSPQVQQAIEG